MQRGKSAVTSGAENPGIRRRQPESTKNPVETEPKASSDGEYTEKDKSVAPKMLLETGTYWLTRVIILRYLAFVYFVAFLVAYHQNSALLGQSGLLPADRYLDNVKSHVQGSRWGQFSYAPTLLWFVDYHNHVDWWLSALAVAGLTLSGAVVLLGSSNLPVMLVVWVLYHSITAVGQRWYSFGWESQLLETGFLAAFLCPLLSLRRFPRATPTSLIVLFGFRWLIFRIMIGAGLIKIRGDKCWRDLTCMNNHYETQPVPNPISYFMHQEPEPFHQFETLTNHFVELVVPILLFLTRRLRIVGGSIQILFQVVLIISGNLSFLNWLTIVPSLACFDDASVQWMFGGAARREVWTIQQNDKHGRSPLKWHNYVRRSLNLSLGLLIAYLSIPIVQNLLSSRQLMNTSFDPLRLVNTYGAFGSITKKRTEVIFQGTYDNPQDPKAKWEEYEFKCKPGSMTRRPCLISPYHYRLDWLMWFAPFQSYQHNPWLIHLAGKFLVNDENVTALISHNPFSGRDPPKWIRAEHYHYKFPPIGSEAANQGAWWTRTYIGSYMPAVSLNSLRSVFKSQNWPVPQLPRGRRRTTGG